MKYPKPKVLGQSQQPRVVVKAHHRAVPKPKVPKHPKKAMNPLDAPITPGSSITFRQAQRMAGNAVKVRYGGQEQGISQQIGQAQQLGQAQQGWYQQYLTQLAAYQKDVTDRAGATNAAVANLANGFRSLDQNNLNAQNAAQQSDAAARGATASGQVSQDASNASVVRQALMGGLGALIAQRGQSAGDYAGNLAHVVAPIQQGQAQAANAKQIQALGEQRTGLKGQEGAFAQTFIDNLSGSEAKNILAASIAGQSYNLKSASQKETVRTHKANEGIAKQRVKAQTNSPAAKKTKAELAFFRKHGYFPPTGKPKAPGANVKKPTAGPGSLTQGQESHVVQQVKGAVAAARSLMSQPGAKSSEVRQLLAAGKVDGTKYPHDVINAAFDLLPTKYGGLGGLSRANVKALHGMGVHVQGVFPLVFGGAKKINAKQIGQTSNGVFGI